MFEQVFLKVKTLLVVGRFICVCFAMLVQRLISLMRVKWLQAALRSSSSSTTSSSTSSSSSSSSTSVPRRECDGWKLMCARLYWICFWIFKMFSFMRKDSSYVALQAED